MTWLRWCWLAPNHLHRLRIELFHPTRMRLQSYFTQDIDDATAQAEIGSIERFARIFGTKHWVES